MEYYKILGLSFVVLHLLILIPFKQVSWRKRLTLSGWVAIVLAVLPFLSQHVTLPVLALIGLGCALVYATIVMVRPSRATGSRSSTGKQSSRTGDKQGRNSTKYVPQRSRRASAAHAQLAETSEPERHSSVASIGREETMGNEEYEIERRVAERMQQIEAERARKEAELAEQVRLIEERAQEQEERVQALYATQQPAAESLATPTQNIIETEQAACPIAAETAVCPSLAAEAAKLEAESEPFLQVEATATTDNRLEDDLLVPQHTEAATDELADDLLSVAIGSDDSELGASDSEEDFDTSFFDDTPADSEAATVAPHEETEDIDQFVAEFLTTDEAEVAATNLGNETTEAEVPAAGQPLDLSAFDFSQDNQPVSYAATTIDEEDYSYYEFLIYEAREMLEAGDIQETVDYFKEVIVDCQKRELRKEALNFLELIRVDLYERSNAELAQEEEYLSLKRRSVND